MGGEVEWVGLVLNLANSAGIGGVAWYCLGFALPRLLRESREEREKMSEAHAAERAAHAAERAAFVAQISSNRDLIKACHEELAVLRESLRK